MSSMSLRDTKFSFNWFSNEPGERRRKKEVDKEEREGEREYTSREREKQKEEEGRRRGALLVTRNGTGVQRSASNRARDVCPRLVAQIRIKFISW